MFVYILYSRSKQKYYVGQTQNADARLERHNRGVVLSTKSGVPWEQVWLKEMNNRSEAILLEKKIKGRGAKRFLEEIGM
jgi:putative endonuclease